MSRTVTEIHNAKFKIATRKKYRIKSYYQRISIVIAIIKSGGIAHCLKNTFIGNDSILFLYL